MNIGKEILVKTYGSLIIFFILTICGMKCIKSIEVLYEFSHLKDNHFKTSVSGPFFINEYIISPVNTLAVLLRQFTESKQSDSATTVPLQQKIPYQLISLTFFVVTVVLTIGLIQRNRKLYISNKALLAANSELKKISEERNKLTKKFNIELRRRTKVEKKIKKLNRELENHVKQRTSQLESANRELEAFAYSVSHDLRTPLRHIDGFSQAIIEDYSDELNTIAKDFLGRIRRASQHMSNLIDGLLDLSRITRCKLNREKVNLSIMAARIIKDISKLDKDRNVAFKITPGIFVTGDERLLQIALYNLLGNAWKFTSAANSALIEFGKLSAKEKKKFKDIDCKIFYVRDNGAGFNMKYADKLFIAFNRLHKTRDFAGSGIGLATVYRIINRHGGRIWTEAKVDHGATFYFTLKQ